METEDIQKREEQEEISDSIFLKYSGILRELIIVYFIGYPFSSDVRKNLIVVLAAAVAALWILNRYFPNSSINFLLNKLEKKLKVGVSAWYVVPILILYLSTTILSLRSIIVINPWLGLIKDVGLLLILPWFLLGSTPPWVKQK